MEDYDIVVDSLKNADHKVLNLTVNIFNFISGPETIFLNPSAGNSHPISISNFLEYEQWTCS